MGPGQKIGTTHVLHYVFIQTQWVGEWKRMFCAVWRAHGLEGAQQSQYWLLFLYGAPYSKWYVHEEKNQHLCIQIYHQQFCLCLMAMDFLFLNLQTILLCTLTTMTVFLQTAKNSSHQLQEMQTTCQAQTPPIIRSQKACSMTSSGISTSKK